MSGPGENSGHDVERTVILPVTPPTPLPAPAADPTADTASPAVESAAPAAPPPTAAAAGPGAAGGNRSVARNSAVMAVGSLISRVTGLLRVVAIGAAIGADAVGNDYQSAIALPNMVFELLVGGVLSSVIVPVLVRHRRQDADAGQAYAQRLLSLAALSLGVAATLAVLAAPLFTRLILLLVDAERHQPGDPELITRLSYLILPALFFYGMAALFGALLNSREHFAAPMFTPILNNIVVTATAVAYLLVTGGEKPTPLSISPAEVLILGLGTTAGIVVQAAGLVPALRRAGFRWKWRFDFRRLGLGELGRLSTWMLLFVVVSQVGVFVVLAIAKAVGDRDAAGTVAFQNAFLIFMMAHGIVAVSVLTALMPRLSAAAADGRHQDLIAQLNSGLRLVSVVLVPITAAYLVLGRPLAVSVFAWFNYSTEDGVRTGSVIAVAGLGLVPYAIMQLQQFAFYALRDTRTPALLNIPVVALRVGLDLLFFNVLSAGLVAAAMMGASSVSFVFGALVSIHLLRRRLGLLGLRQVGVVLAKLVGAATVAGALAYLVVYLLTVFVGDGKWASIVQLVVGGAVLAVMYYVLTLAFRVGEVRDLTRMVRGRLGRSG